MIKVLINLGSLLVCLGILAFGGYQTVQTMQIDDMVSDFQSALESTPDLPDLPNQPDDPENPDQPNNPDNPENPDKPVNPGDPSNPDQPDSDFGFIVPEGSDAIIDPDSTLEVEDADTSVSKTVQAKLDLLAGKGKQADVLSAYDISLVLDGAAVQPGGAVIVTLPAPDNAADYESLQVVFIDDSGKVTPCDTTINADGSVSFLTDHFSRYAIIGIYHEHKFVEGKCECGESDPNYVPPHVHEFVEGECACGESDPNYVPPHVHAFVEGKCACGEVNPNYKPPHVHEFVEGECKCGESDPNYVPPHKHKFVEGKCECGEINPNYVPETPEHTHNYVEGECACGESDPNYVPPHKHKYVEGKCECGEVNPDYVPPHVHKFVEGKCECGESDPNYVPPHKHKFVEGKCECGEVNPNYVPPHVHNFVEGKCECGETNEDYKAPGLSTEEAKDSFSNIYDTYDPDFKELNKEFFMGMVSGALGTNKPLHTHSYVDGVCSCGEADPNYHKHKFVEGKCECGEVNPNYKPPHVHEFVEGKCSCGEADPNYHKHKFVEGKCACGEINPNYVPETPAHTHKYVDGECECGESDPNYVPPHVHAFVEGKCACGEINPDYVPPHVHEFVEGECACGESDPNYVPPHEHRFIEGKCECGEVNPDYVPPHVHEFVEGECACGESDPNYVPPHVHKFVEGKCSCGEEDPNYSANIPSFDDELDSDDYVPEEAPSEGSGSSETVNDLIVDVAGTYFDKLQEGIEQNQQNNSDKTEEEQAAARDEFVQKEADAFSGLLNIVTKPEESTEEELVESVDAILGSSVCLGTVTESVQKNENLSGTVQDATSNLDESTKNEIQNKIEAELAANPENEQQYNDLANLFGITLGSGTTIPGEGDLPENFDPSQIPEGVNPEDYLGKN